MEKLLSFSSVLKLNKTVRQIFLFCLTLVVFYLAFQICHGQLRFMALAYFE